MVSTYHLDFQHAADSGESTTVYCRWRALHSQVGDGGSRLKLLGAKLPESPSP
jgi:hypothetical protein